MLLSHDSAGRRVETITRRDNVFCLNISSSSLGAWETGHSFANGSVGNTRLSGPEAIYQSVDCLKSVFEDYMGNLTSMMSRREEVSLERTCGILLLL